MRLLQLIEILLNEILLNADWCMTKKRAKKMNRGGCDLHMAMRAKIGTYTELMDRWKLWNMGFGDALGKELGD